MGLIRSLQVSLAAPLDRENKASYAISIMAQDGANPPLNSSTLVEVIVEDGKYKRKSQKSPISSNFFRKLSLTRTNLFSVRGLI